MIDQHEIDEAVSEILKKNKAFFSFSNSRFEEQRDKDIPADQYCDAGSGMICPIKNQNNLIEELTEVYDKHNNRILLKYGVDRIIDYELANHEIDITWDITDTYEAVSIYGISRESILDRCNKRGIYAS